MFGQENQAFEENELDILENGQRKTESVTNQDATPHNKSKSWRNAIDAYTSKHQRVFKTFGLIILNLFIIAYVVYAGIYWKNHNSDCDLQWCNGYGLLLILIGIIYINLFYFLIVKRHFTKHIAQCCWPVTNFLVRLQNTKYGTRIGATVFYSIVLLAVIIFLIFDTVDNRERLIGILGVVVILGLGWLFSKHPKQINWRTVFWGLFLQFSLGLFMLRWPVGRSIFECISHKVTTFLDFTKAGSGFVFSNELVNEIGVFAFSALPVLFFFSFFTQILSYLGAMQWILLKLGWFVQSILGTTLCESLTAVANPFIGMSESPLMIKPYINKLTSSELHAIISSGFSTVSGSVLAAYILFGANTAHLIISSIMSTPTSLYYSKLFYPETEESLTKSDNIKLEKTSDNNILDAAANGALAAISIVLGIIANIVAFVSFIAFVNAVLSWCGSLVGYEALSLEIILAKIFIPLSWIIGVPWDECEKVGMLIGLKIIVNELIAYQKLGKLKDLSARSRAIVTFAICGFANPGSIGIQIGLFSSLAPEKKEQVTRVILRSFIVGNAVCFLTASIAGILIDELSLPSNNDTTIIISNTTTTMATSSVSM